MENENEVNEADLLARVLESTEFLDDADLPPVPEQDQVEEAVEEDNEEILEDEEVVEEDEAEVEEDEGEEEDEETEGEEADEAEEPEGDLPEEDDIDWDYQIPVKIDGETQYLSLEEVRKGYATQQHLSNQGRELGETRKLIEEERNARLGEVEQMAYALNETLGAQEQAAAQQYHAIDAEINKARDEGDTYKVQELKDQREVAQQQYWAVHNRREALVGQYAQVRQQAEVEQWNQKVQGFYEGITEVIPDYDEKYAEDLRAFGAEQGISDEYMQSITDPTIVKVLDDYRKLKMGVSEGAKKRAKAPVKKAPTKKTRTEKQKDASKKNMTKARAFREDASKEDQDAFLKQMASRSLGLD